MWRKFSPLVIALAMAILPCEAAPENTPPAYAKSIEEIKQLTGTDLSDAEAIQTDQGKLLLVLVERGFGVSYNTIYLYKFSNEEWRLTLSYQTNSSRISHSIKADNLILWSKSGREILSAPLKYLFTDFDRAEQ